MTRSEFLLRVFVLLLAASGWAAFAGAYSRLYDTEEQLREVTEAYRTSADQNLELGRSFESVRKSHESLHRLKDLKLQQLEEKVRTYEYRLRQLGLIQE